MTLFGHILRYLDRAIFVSYFDAMFLKEIRQFAGIIFGEAPEVPYMRSDNGSEFIAPDLQVGLRRLALTRGSNSIIIFGGISH